jgi:hypothetical protein
MADIDKLIEMLQSPKASRRFDACEELRVAPSLPPPAISALEQATNDPDRLVRESAARALAVQEPSFEPPPRTASTAAHESRLKGSKSIGPALILAGLAIPALCLLEVRTDAQAWQFTTGWEYFVFGAFGFGLVLIVLGIRLLLR